MTKFVSNSNFESINSELMILLQKHYSEFLEDLYNLDLTSDTSHIDDAHATISRMRQADNTMNRL